VGSFPSSRAGGSRERPPPRRLLAATSACRQLRASATASARLWSVNARLKDGFGGRFVRVRGHANVMYHLLFGVLALTVDQLMRLFV